MNGAARDDQKMREARDVRCGPFTAMVPPVQMSSSRSEMFGFVVLCSAEET